MIFDKETLFSNDQAVTNSQASTNYIDLGSVRDIGAGAPIEVFAVMTATALSAGSSTLVAAIETDTQSSFATRVTLSQTPAMAKASLVAGYEFLQMKLPQGVQRYLRLNFTVATADFTAGTIRAGLILDRHAQAHYASGLNVSGF
jgi:hypothetical protein